MFYVQLSAYQEQTGDLTAVINPNPACKAEKLITECLLIIKNILYFLETHTQ